MPPYVLRRWSDRDAGNDRVISDAVYPEYQDEPGHSSWFPARQLGAPAECSSRYLVESHQGSPIGYATIWELRPTRYRFDLAIRPESQRQGIGSVLFTQVIRDAERLGATGLQARVRDDKPEPLAFVIRRGFHETHRMGAYRIDFSGVPASDPEEARSRLRKLGFEVTTLAALRVQDAHYLTRFHELYSAARHGWPDPDPDPAGPVPTPIEQLKSWLDAADQPEAFFIAKQGDRHIGFTSFFSIGTAVHPDYRSRGIATMLKSVSIADARSRGLKGQTSATANPAMQKVFERLGYRRLRSEIRLIRPIP